MERTLTIEAFLFYSFSWNSLIVYSPINISLCLTTLGILRRRNWNKCTFSSLMIPFVPIFRWKGSYSSAFIHCNDLTQKDDPNIHSKGIKDTNFFFFKFCCSVDQSRSTLCDPMDCSMPGFPVLYHLSELAQTHVHWVHDAIQPSHPLLSPSPALNLSQHQGLF